MPGVQFSCDQKKEQEFDQKEKKTVTYKEALELAKKELLESTSDPAQVVIMENKTITKEYGWIFFPASKKYVETGDRKYLIPGLSPVIVNKNDSSVVRVPSSVTLELFLRDYEKSHQ
jgi:hypothetical protein